MATSPNWFPEAPSPIRSVFRRFPLRLFSPEALPSEARCDRPQLFLYTNRSDSDRPGFTPSCLKWQLWLRICGIRVEIRSSNAHASPGRSLPFVVPAMSDSQSPNPIPSSLIAAYARNHSSYNEPQIPSLRFETYLSLFESSIQPAWLYTLYLVPENACLVAVLFMPRSHIIHPHLLRQLRLDAHQSIISLSRHYRYSAQLLLNNATQAFLALDKLLGSSAYFFDAPSPTIFDATVFSYTHLILPNSSIHWPQNPLRPSLDKCHNLQRHRRLLYSRYFPVKL
ncbi:hypothetical protein CDD81_5312 [Ophiocordyceps australis]|uniref:Thioredoxin-like fold domain-containing protein n=1 Tax=Ophiocordyceps australis TaxID=1399860 RepID=A0A2C5YHK7_9HYPO|nr:hypothetical protein CDD81_5312 [Ophiocordyceps australis]